MPTRSREAIASSTEIHTAHPPITKEQLRAEIKRLQAIELQDGFPKLFHVTSAEAAAKILAEGFRDNDTIFGIKGVFVSNRPLDLNEGPVGDSVLLVKFRVPLRGTWKALSRMADNGPGLDGMRFALFLFNLSVFKDPYRMQVSRTTVRPWCHLFLRQQTWQEIETSQQPQTGQMVLPATCGGR